MSKVGYGNEGRKIGNAPRDHWLTLTPDTEALLDADTPVYEDSEGRFVRLADFAAIAARKPATGVR